VHVTSGWVGFEWHGRESFIPAGAMCITRPGRGPGTPHYEDTSDAFRLALDTIDLRRGSTEMLSAALDRALGRHITINATGAVAAVLADVGIPAEIMRGFALTARCAGLVGHIHEEQQQPAMVTIWEAAERAVPYKEK